MLQPIAQTERALHDTLVHKATGGAFDKLARFLGLPRLVPFTVPAWRRALRSVAYGPRGVPGALQGLLEGMFADYEATYACTVAPGAPQTLTFVSGTTGTTGFTLGCVCRLWRVTGGGIDGVYWSVGPDFVADPVTPSATLTLCPVATAYWGAADWAAAGAAVDAPVVAVLLPFTYREAGCQIDVYLGFANAEAPPTYVQTLYQWGAGTTPDAAAETRYLDYQDEGIDAAALAVEADGAFVVTEAATWSGFQVDTSAPVGARGGTHTVTLRKNGVDTALVVVLGESDVTGVDAVNTVDVAVDDVMTVSIVSGAGVTEGLLDPRAVVFQDPPASLPDGGNIVEVTESGNPDTGPWPIYLPDGTAAEIAAAIDALQASGVKVTAQAVDFATFMGVP